MKLERHVGGMSRQRKASYLTARSWKEKEGRWHHEIFGDHPLAKAIHHQLTDDLSQAMRKLGWRIQGFSERGYVQLEDSLTGERCSLPKALRLQARRERRPVAELTYSLFLAALLQSEEHSPK
jgi:hypothetical protein